MQLGSSAEVLPAGATGLTRDPARPPRGPASPPRVAEFLAVGGLTPLLFPLSWLLRAGLGLDRADYAVAFTMFYAAHVLNDPHFAVTYLLFYRDARARAFGDALGPGLRVRYVIVGFVIPLVLAAWGLCALALRSAPTLGWLLQTMFFLVGWHYVKQGFGVMILLAARRGVIFQPRERWAILAHCFAGWAYAWASPADPGTEVEEKGVVYTTLAHSVTLERVTHAVLLASAIPLAVMLVQKRLREGRLPIFTPLSALLVSVWLWSIYSGVDPLVRYMNPALHSLQYLFVVYLLKGAQAREREGAPWFEMSANVRLGLLAVSALALGWVLFHGAPAALDAALVPRARRGVDVNGPLGETPFFAVIYAFVNIHHYFMDTVIWRKDNPEMRYLRGAGPVRPEGEPRGANPA